MPIAAFSERSVEATESEIKPAPKAQIKRLKLVKKSAKRSRDVSQVGFPYNDLESAIGVARAILHNGGSQLSRDQLAGALGQSPASGSFIIKVSSAKQFGLVDSRDGKFQLTDLGFSILDKNELREKQARVQAFLNIGLYKKLYDDFKGKQLPPRPHGLEHTLVQIGVTPKQKGNARLAFEKSAKQAGFFNVDPDRLIEPVIAPTQVLRPPLHIDGESFGVGNAGSSAGDGGFSPSPPSGKSGLDPLIQGLLSRLPNPGESWSPDKRQKWLQTLAANLEMIYPPNDDSPTEDTQ
jgi:hypothetical protein